MVPSLNVPTLLHPSSSTLGGSSQPHIAEPNQLLCSYYHSAIKTYHYLVIPRHHPISLCSSPTSLIFLCQPNFCQVPLATYKKCNGTFPSQGECTACQPCWLLVFWQMLFYLPVQSCPIMSGLSKLMKAGENSQLLAETAIMPLPNSSQFVSKWGAKNHCQALV